MTNFHQENVKTVPLADNPAHIVRPRDREPDALPGAPQGPAEGRARPMLRVAAPLAGDRERPATPGPTPSRHITAETATTSASPSR